MKTTPASHPLAAAALALLVGGRYAMGYAQGLESREAAIAEALAYCEQWRKDRRIEAECRLHAVGDEVVSD